jgi:putative ABC transport system substrate-binding protein
MTIFIRKRYYGFFVFAILVIVISIYQFRNSEATLDYKIGLISNNPNGIRNVIGFKDALSSLGYVEDINTTYIFSGKPTPRNELRDVISAFVEDDVDLIFTAGTPTGMAAWTVTQDTSIPVVFGVVADPLTAGIIDSYDTPGGNMTGIMLSKNQARRLELLKEFFPSIKRVLLPYNPDDPAPRDAAIQLSDIAAQLNVELLHRHAQTSDEALELIKGITNEYDAVFMLPDSIVNRQLSELISRTNALGIPVSGPSSTQTEGGATMSYGIVHGKVGAQAAPIADKILQGADPATVPIQEGAFFLVVNLAATKRMGIPISEENIKRADVVLRQDKL